jgi:transposase
VGPEKGDRVRKTRKFPPEFRHEAVELYRNSDRSLEQVAKELGIGGSTLARWHYQLGREAKQQDEPTSNERAELRRLRRENRRLKEEREILKKAAAFFARESETP